MYLVKATWWFKKLFPKDLLWLVTSAHKPAIYITFDDGPHPEATIFALDQLARYEARATFFCIGKNVVEYPLIYERILADGHAVGNHTHNHLNGWKTATGKYLENIAEAGKFINSMLFRPPYGKIKRRQAAALRKLGYTIVMWDILSGDFDREITPDKCWENVVLHLSPGSIIVLHDSSKAFPRMSSVLPRLLEHCRQRGWEVRSLHPSIS